MLTRRYKLALFVQAVVVLQRIHNGGSLFFAQPAHWTTEEVERRNTSLVVLTCILSNNFYSSPTERAQLPTKNLSSYRNLTIYIMNIYI